MSLPINKNRCYFIFICSHLSETAVRVLTQFANGVHMISIFLCIWVIASL